MRIRGLVCLAQLHTFKLAKSGLSRLTVHSIRWGETQLVYFSDMRCAEAYTEDREDVDFGIGAERVV